MKSISKKTSHLLRKSELKSGHLLVYVLDQLGPILNGSHQAASVNEVKLLAVGIAPMLALKIVDFEPKVWRNIDWLQWTEIDSDNLTFGMLVGKVDGPDT